MYYLWLYFISVELGHSLYRNIFFYRLMTNKNTKNIAIFSIVALFTVTSFVLSNAYAEESNDYNMVGDVMPVLTFTFRDGIETHEFPVFKMGENFIDDSGVSFLVEGTYKITITT